jgi:hypothetical protein
MKYFKNIELAKLYNVSEKSVRNWIESAQANKLDLQLEEVNGRFYVANTSKNAQQIEKLVEKGKKFKNTRGFRVISPGEKFYETYSQEQILDIISNLSIYHEIPTMYSYADGGAKYWDEYAKRLIDEEAPNLLTKTIELLEMNAEYLDRLTQEHKRINVVDLGPGNGLPIRPTLARLLKQGKLNRYIALDGSKEMLHILEQNIAEWFDGAVSFEGHVRDFSNERFHDLFAYDQIDEEGNAPVNLVFLLGGTLNNFRSPSLALQTINASLGLNDVVIYVSHLDTPSTRRYFDFTTTYSSQKGGRSELPLEFLGIDESMFTREQTFDEKNKARLGRIYPKVDLSIKLQSGKGTQYIELRKNEPILLWRHWHKNAIEFITQFDQCGFDIAEAAKSIDGQYLLLISKIKTGLED